MGRPDANQRARVNVLAEEYEFLQREYQDAIVRAKAVILANLERTRALEQMLHQDITEEQQRAIAQQVWRNSIKIQQAIALLAEVGIIAD